MWKPRDVRDELDFIWTELSTGEVLEDLRKIMKLVLVSLIGRDFVENQWRISDMQLISYWVR